MNITIVGAGYVGLSLAVLLAQHHCVTLMDVVQEKVDKINARISPIQDAGIEEYLAERALNLHAVTQADWCHADYIIVAVPTNYNSETNRFDTSVVDATLASAISAGTRAVIVIKSTIPVGYTEQARKKFGYSQILFSPEFLRESKALYDNLYPSRIIVSTAGDGSAASAEAFAALLGDAALRQNTPRLIMGATEAEAVKLFANTYLALRVSYFNELDTYAEVKGLDTRQIIQGVCLDPRIGDHYNNPSFGYGGYCLPKDTKQLLANYQDVPEQLIGAIVTSNRTRKDHIAHQIAERNPRLVGLYKLAMKNGSDNYRSSAILGVAQRLQEQGIPLVIYEPILGDADSFIEIPVERDLEKFLAECDVIISNRQDPALDGVKQKVYTRDVFTRD